jgi:DNA helicase-2/ATP-dependent DNA helicase PcrA
MQKPLMQDVLVNKYPILLIDESQDTIKSLMEALFEVQAKHQDKFTLGLFGDIMQRIYGHGKEDLGKSIPSDWARPAKKMNHRCPKRVVKLINKIRSAVDNQEQMPRLDKEEGFVRFFILPTSTTTKSVVEERVKEQMASITKDSLWTGSDAYVKILTLEHHMAARRMGFERMFEILSKAESLRTGLLDGKLPGLRLFTQQVLPIVKAKRMGDDFAIASIVRKHSPLLAWDTLKSIEKDQLPQVEKTKKAVDDLLALWTAGKEPRFLDVLRNIAKTGLFEIPESLLSIASRSETEQETVELNNTPAVLEDDESDYIFNVWDEFLLTPFGQVEPYSSYINGEANFGTHQGIKGLEFPRVMVIIDDNEARGFMFSFDKIFGIKEMTKTDIENEREGKDTGINRTKRLFYVTCSRAEKSLAIVYYSSDPGKTRQQLLAEGWFENNEIVDVN